MGTSSPGLAPLSGLPLLTQREWQLVQSMEARAKAARAANLVIEARVWERAALLVREQLSHIDIDLRDPTVFSLISAG